MFTPRLLMSAEQRDINDTLFGGIDDLRRALRTCNDEKRALMQRESQWYLNHSLKAYGLSCLALLGALTAAIINLVMGIELHQFGQVVCAIAITGVVLCHLQDYEAKRNVYFGARRHWAEFSNRESCLEDA